MPGRFRAGYHFIRGHSPLYVPGLRLPGTTVDLSAPIFDAGEEGDQANAIVVITFSEAIQASNYSLGVTIKIDGVAATISSAALQPDNTTVYYTLSAPWAAANSSVTYSYSDVTGDYADLSNNQMGDITNQAVTNNVGRHLRFDDAPNSMHLAWL